MYTNLRPRTLTWLAGMLVTAVLSRDVHAQLITTGPPAPGPASITPNWFGSAAPNRYSEGQSFAIAPAFPNITSFSFYLSNLSATEHFETLPFRGFLAAFDPTTRQIQGPLLYQSPQMMGFASLTPTLVTFALPTPLALNPGQTYLAFVSGAGVYPTSFPDALGGIHQSAGDTYAPGLGLVNVVGVGSNSLAEVVAGAWNPPVSPAVGTDYAFQATFTAAITTPEPTTVALMLPGLLAVGGLARRYERGRRRS